MLWPLAFAAVANAQVADLQRCPSIADAAARLACYDAAMPPTAGRPASLAGPGTDAPGPAPVLSSARPPAAPATSQDTFGLPQAARAEEVGTIQSPIGPGFQGWGPKERIRLHNGQVWEVTDGSNGTPSASFAPVVELGFWVQDGGPLTISNAGGNVHLTLLESTPVQCRSTIVLGVGAAEFMSWQRHLGERFGHRLEARDHDVSWSLYFDDPDGNPYEITTHEHEAVSRLLRTEPVSTPGSSSGAPAAGC